MFKVEKNIEMPPAKRRYEDKYPWRAMEVGDSFFVPLPEGKSMAQVRSSISGCISNITRRNKSLGKFASRRVEGGIRVWRVE